MGQPRGPAARWRTRGPCPLRDNRAKPSRSGAWNTQFRRRGRGAGDDEHGRPTVPFQASTPGNPGRVGEDSARPRAALRFRRSQDRKRVILTESDCPNRRVSNRATMVPAGSKPGTDETRLERKRTMASDYVDDFLRDERESFNARRRRRRSSTAVLTISAKAHRRCATRRGNSRRRPRHEPDDDRGQAGDDRN